MRDRPTCRPVYKALHRPLTICGVDRRLFFLALVAVLLAQRYHLAQHLGVETVALGLGIDFLDVGGDRLFLFFQTL